MAKPVSFFKKTPEEKKTFLEQNDLKSFKDFYLWVALFPAFYFLFFIIAIVCFATGSATGGGILLGFSVLLTAITLGIQFVSKTGFWIHYNNRGAQSSTAESQQALLETQRAELEQASGKINDDF